jgi:hypothetical protein
MACGNRETETEGGTGRGGDSTPCWLRYMHGTTAPTTGPECAQDGTTCRASCTGTKPPRDNATTEDHRNALELGDRRAMAGSCHASGEKWTHVRKATRWGRVDARGEAEG